MQNDIRSDYKILVIKLDHIGDVLLSTPVFRAVKEKYPGCFLAAMVCSTSKKALENNKFIDKIYCYDALFFDRNNTVNEVTYIKNMKTLVDIQNMHFDISINLRDDYNNVLIQYMTKSKLMVSHNSNTKFANLIDTGIPYDPSKHESQRHFDLLECIGIERPSDIRLDFFPAKEDEEWVENFLRENDVKDEDILMGFFPGGGWYLNWWPFINFVELGNKITKMNKNVKIILVGGKSEVEVSDRIEERLESKPIIAAGKTTLHQLGALFKRMKLLVSDDGGPMHLASAVGTPIVALFGPSPYSKFGPVGKGHTIISKNYPCSPCPQFQAGEALHCKDNKCMKDITVEEVYEAVYKKLKEIS